MSDRCFVDTNILIYAHDVSSGSKNQIASELVEKLSRTYAQPETPHVDH